MALLLDTHVFYWVVLDSPRLSARHRRLLTADQSAKFVSAVTGWEIAATVRLGKWPDAAQLLPGLDKIVERAGFHHLPLTIVQAERAGSFTAEHRDPFDRLLAAQAARSRLDSCNRRSADRDAGLPRGMSPPASARIA